MMIVRKALEVGLILATLLISASALGASLKNRELTDPLHEATAVAPSGQSAPASSLPSEVLINPVDLARLFQSTTGKSLCSSTWDSMYFTRIRRRSPTSDAASIDYGTEMR